MGKMEREGSKEKILGKRKSKQGLEIYVSRCSKPLYKKKNGKDKPSNVYTPEKSSFIVHSSNHLPSM